MSQMAQIGMMADLVLLFVVYVADVVCFVYEEEKSKVVEVESRMALVTGRR